MSRLSSVKMLLNYLTDTNARRKPPQPFFSELIIIFWVLVNVLDVWEEMWSLQILFQMLNKVLSVWTNSLSQKLDPPTMIRLFFSHAGASGLFSLILRPSDEVGRLFTAFFNYFFLNLAVLSMHRLNLAVATSLSGHSLFPRRPQNNRWVTFFIGSGRRAKMLQSAAAKL